MEAFYIDPDIRKAETPPGSFYTDTDVYKLLGESVFARSWQWVGVKEAVNEPGSVYPFTFLETLVNESLILVKDEEGVIRCLSNVCTHRGNILATAAGKCKKLRCKYHGRRFDLSGRMEFMPEFDGVEGFPGKNDHLQLADLGVLGRFLFTSPDPFCSFEEWMAPVNERMGWLNLDKVQLDRSRSKDYSFNANWMLYVDNYLEGFHIPFVHKSLNAAIDFPKYETHCFKWGTLQVAVGAPGSPCLEIPEGYPDHGKNIAAYYFWLFPNIMLNFYPWGLSINIVRPKGVENTTVSFISYVSNPIMLDLGAGSGLDIVEMEDEEVVLNVQKGIKSKLYKRGRYSPKMETGVHAFHRMLLSFMEDAK